jgi:predicted lipoprotein with Yx(FWY)xxD motif
MCGGGDWQVCLDNWPYVRAADGVTGASRTWRVVTLDPQTGHFAEQGAPGALSVWAYRDRPVYTYAGDKKPGDVNGGGIGEWRGQRNGLRAFWLRDDFMRGGL